MSLADPATAARVLPVVLLVLLGLKAADGPARPPDGAGPGDADIAAAARAQCARQAAALPAPDPAVAPIKPGHASPASPFDRAQPWARPYPAASAAVERAEAAGDTATAARLRRITAQPVAWWLDDHVTGEQLSAEVEGLSRSASRDAAVLVLVAYAIPLRDCGGESTGGTGSGADYLRWVHAVATGLGRGRSGGTPEVAVVLEPDALALLDMLPEDRRDERLRLLRAATARLTSVPGTAVYLDAGHSGWVDDTVMADRLSRAGVAMARGFSLNVSAFGWTSDEVSYGRRVSSRVGWKRFVVDTSRNGNGPPPDGVRSWCNPAGRALGEIPRVAPARNVDAYLWVKPPGESDGSCGPGQPEAGQIWAEYAADLAGAAGW